MKIGIVGAGYVGLVTGLCLTEKGHDVLCLDVVEEKVRKINSGEPPIYEEGIGELMERNDLKATLNPEGLSDREAIFVAVPTPTKKSGEMETKFLRSAFESLSPLLSESWKVIVVKSTVVPGTTETLASTLPGEPGEDYGLAMNPEFLREGKAIGDFLRPDRIVIGAIDKRSGDTVEKIYAWSDAPILRTDIRTAEMIKYAANSFLATKISFINETANVCSRLGIDVQPVARAVGMDSRISPLFLNAGPGFGGSCFPKDVAALVGRAESVGYEPFLLKSVLHVNERQPLQILEWLDEELVSLEGKKIALLGLAFKAGTDDTRESRSIFLADKLLEQGAEVMAYDPEAVYEKVTKGEMRDVLEGAEAVVVMTDWPEIRDIDLEEAASLVARKLLLDGRRAIDPEKAKKAGFKYYGIGYPRP